MMMLWVSSSFMVQAGQAVQGRWKVCSSSTWQYMDLMGRVVQVRHVEFDGMWRHMGSCATCDSGNAFVPAANNCEFGSHKTHTSATKTTRVLML
jgi:hypothetical protein